MTLKEFLNAFSNLPKDKFKAVPVNRHNEDIRLVHSSFHTKICFCPITAVCVVWEALTFMTSGVVAAAALLGLGPRIRDLIINAADNRSPRTQEGRRLRRQLLTRLKRFQER